MSTKEEEQKGLFAERIREIREKKRKTQAEFAELAGVTARAQRNYEAGLRTPNISYLQELAYEGVDVGYILTGLETKMFDRGQVMAFDWLADSLGLDFMFRINVTAMLSAFHAGDIDQEHLDRELAAALEQSRLGVLDTELLARIIEAVEVQAPGLVVRKKAGVVSLLYRAFRPSGCVDTKAVKEAVELAK